MVRKHGEGKSAAIFLASCSILVIFLSSAVAIARMQATSSSFLHGSPFLLSKLSPNSCPPSPFSCLSFAVSLPASSHHRPHRSFFPAVNASGGGMDSSSKGKGGGWLERLGFGPTRASSAATNVAGMEIAQGPDTDAPAPGQQFAQFGAGCFWGVELAFQRVPGVSRTEVGYTQGTVHNPSYNDVCEGTTGHSEVVRVQYDPKEASFESLMGVFWARHDPTTLNRQGNDAGTQYRSGVYVYTPEQEKIARETLERHQKTLNRKIVTEILPAKKFYRAEEYHQQYLAKGGRMGFKQSAEKGCNDPIRCYG